MIKLFTVAAMTMAFATAATAYDPPQKPKGDTHNVSQGQGQQQGQGQAQGQAQGQGQDQGQAQSQANSQTTNVTTEASAFAPGFGVDSCVFSISGGVVGASAGLGIPMRNCAVEREVLMLKELAGPEVALRHYATHNSRVRKTMRGGITDQTVGGKYSSRSTSRMAEPTQPSR